MGTSQYIPCMADYYQKISKQIKQAKSNRKSISKSRGNTFEGCNSRASRTYQSNNDMNDKEMLAKIHRNSRTKKKEKGPRMTQLQEIKAKTFQLINSHMQNKNVICASRQKSKKQKRQQANQKQLNKRWGSKKYGDSDSNGESMAPIAYPNNCESVIQIQ